MNTVTVVASLIPSLGDYAVNGMAEVTAGTGAAVNCWDETSFSSTTSGTTGEFADLATNGILFGSPATPIWEVCEDVHVSSPANPGTLFNAQLTGTQVTTANSAARKRRLGLRPRNRITPAQLRRELRADKQSKTR